MNIPDLHHPNAGRVFYLDPEFTTELVHDMNLDIRGIRTERVAPLNWVPIRRINGGMLLAICGSVDPA